MFFFTSPGSGLNPGSETGSLVGWLVGQLGGRIPSISSISGFLSRLRMGHDLIWWQFRVDRGWFGVSVGLAEILMRAGLGFVWGSFSLGKGPICRMRLGWFQADFGSVLAWLGLILARCAAGLAVASETLPTASCISLCRG